MSGWIKLEKDLLTDPRLLRLAGLLRHSMSIEVSKSAQEGWAECNGLPLPGEIVILGALAKLWMIADTHIGDDDVLPLGIDEVDQLFGIPGLAEMLPENWLQVIDANHVKLPGYHAHNGTIAKERALNQKRVAKSRDKAKRSTVTRGNGKPLPDQDQDQDQDQDLIPLPSVGVAPDGAPPAKVNGKGPDKPKKPKRGSLSYRVPHDFVVPDQQADWAAKEFPAIDLFNETQKFRDHEFQVPRSDWVAAWRNWMRKANERLPSGGGNHGRR